MNLEKIATLAGVSRSTVSRVINNHPYVSSAVRQRVLDVIEREGFEPNAPTRTSLRNRTEVIGVIAPEGLGIVLSSMYFPILLTGISTTITAADYAMSLWAGSTPDETERIFRRILSHKLLDGVLLNGVVVGDTLPQRLIENDIPLVVIGHSEIPDVSTVDVDNSQAARMATEYLIGLGRRRIGHISGTMRFVAARERLNAYRAALEIGGIGYDPRLVITGDYTQQSGYDAAERLLALGIDAVFAANDLMAMGLINALTERGIRIPEDVSIVGFDDLPIAATTIPPLTTIRQPIYDLGVIATNLLIDVINGNVQTHQHITLPTDLVIRETCCPACPR